MKNALNTTNIPNCLLQTNTIVEKKAEEEKKHIFLKKIKMKLLKLNVFHWFDCFSNIKISLEEMDISGEKAKQL